MPAKIVINPPTTKMLRHTSLFLRAQVQNNGTAYSVHANNIPSSKRGVAVYSGPLNAIKNEGTLHANVPINAASNQFCARNVFHPQTITMGNAKMIGPISVNATINCERLNNDNEPKCAEMIDGGKTKFGLASK